MRGWKLFNLAICALSAFLATVSAHAREFGWADLVDMSVQDFEDPYRDLSYDQIDDVRTVLVQRQNAEDISASEEQRAEARNKLAEANARLAAQNLDADWLIDQRWIVANRRERAATAGNPAVDGQTVVLAGFALAGPPTEDGTPVAYLVPERGMCSHMPPPNPNQMIRVLLKGDWTPSFAHEPVRLTGRVTISPTDEVFHVVDGPVQMRATFVMDAEKVETIAHMRAQGDPKATREWAKQMSERLRASGIPMHSGRTSSE